MRVCIKYPTGPFRLPDARYIEKKVLSNASNCQVESSRADDKLGKESKYTYVRFIYGGW